MDTGIAGPDGDVAWVLGPGQRWSGRRSFIRVLAIDGGGVRG